jgi:hypothetical protein
MKQKDQHEDGGLPPLPRDLLSSGVGDLGRLHTHAAVSRRRVAHRPLSPVTSKAESSFLR